MATIRFATCVKHVSCNTEAENFLVAMNCMPAVEHTECCFVVPHAGPSIEWAYGALTDIYVTPNP